MISCALNPEVSPNACSLSFSYSLPHLTNIGQRHFKMTFISFIGSSKNQNAASSTKYDAIQSRCKPIEAPHSWYQILPILGLNLLLSLLYSGTFCYAVRNMLLNRHEIGLIYCELTQNLYPYRPVDCRLSVRFQSDFILAPARSVVSYESRYLDQSMPSPFNQAPSLEVDTAWHQLIKCGYSGSVMQAGSYVLSDHLADNNIMLQAEDLEQINKTSVLLRDKSAYLGGLDVFHELHCLVRGADTDIRMPQTYLFLQQNYIRENVYADYYALEPGKFRTEHLCEISQTQLLPP